MLAILNIINRSTMVEFGSECVKFYLDQTVLGAEVVLAKP
jgi:hypothetical protein